MVFGLPREKSIATAASVALAINLTRIPVYLSQCGFYFNHYRFML